jgi:hypothetical protein
MGIDVTPLLGLTGLTYTEMPENAYHMSSG